MSETGEAIDKKHAWEGRFQPLKEGDRWQCVRCGDCCRSVFDEAWVKFMGGDIDKDGQCINLDGTPGKTRCAIYERRPNPCRVYPFSLRKVEPGKYTPVIHRKCPGFGEGPEIDRMRRIAQTVKCSNEELARDRKIDLTDFEETGCVSLN